MLLSAGMFLTAGPAFPGDSPKIVPSKMTPPSAAPDLSDTALLRGKFLVASREMSDPRFLETVILLVDYGPNGAMGLIINRPTKTKLSHAFPDMEGLRTRSDIFYMGGPVKMDQVFLLIRSDSAYEDSSNVFKDVYFSGSMTALQRMIDKGETGKRFRVYAGYAGWGPRQLDAEVALGGWHVMPADGESIFEKEPSQIWPELIRRRSLKWIRDWNAPLFAGSPR